MVRVFSLCWILCLAMFPAVAQEPAGTADAPEPAAAPSEESADTPAAEEEAAPGEEGAPAADEERFVIICPISDEIDEGIAVVVKRAAQLAEKAEAIVFVVNTPGGRVDSAIEITTAIMGIECPTIAYIEGMGAISAGAIISYSCDYIYMSEGTSIGASTPIMPGVETTEAMDEKSNSFIRSKYQALGEANGHEPLLGLAMVDRNIEVRAYRDPEGVYHFERTDSPDDDEYEDESDFLNKILDAVSEDPEGGEEISDLLRKVVSPESRESAPADKPRSVAGNGDLQQWIEENTEIVSRQGELLTLSSREATKYGLSEAITKDVDETLRKFLLGSVNRMYIEPTWDEALFAFLTSPTIAGLLLMAGLGGIYVEVRTPGFGAPGIIGATCLALFFGSHMVLGMASWIDVALIIAGFLLIVAEVFLLPGFGVAGIMGIVCLAAGSYMALVKAPIPEFAWELEHTHEALYTLTVTMVTLLIFIVVSGLILPRTPLGRALVLAEVQHTDAGYTAQSSSDAQAAIGLVGTALTPLRPAGRGRFGLKKYDIVTRGEFIDSGTPIQIIESSGNRYVVTEVKSKETA